MEQAFGVSKGHFKILLKRMDIGLENTVKTIRTCCVLHNICQLHEDCYIDDDNVLDQVLRNARLMRKAQQANNNVSCPNANVLRDILADFVEKTVNKCFKTSVLKTNVFFISFFPNKISVLKTIYPILFFLSCKQLLSSSKNFLFFPLHSLSFTLFFYNLTKKHPITFLLFSLRFHLSLLQNS